MQIDPKVPIANDATASIVMSGLIGGNYISIDMGSHGAPPLADGAEIRTIETPDLNTLMTEIGGLGKQLQDSLGSFSKALNGDGKGGGGIIQKLDKLVSDNSSRIDATMSNLQEITGKINRGEGTLGKLVNDPKLHDELLATVAEIRATATQAKEFVSSAESMMDQVKSGQGPLGTLVYDQKAADDIKASIANIRSVSDKLAKGEGTLGKLINDPGLYNSAQVTIKKVDRTLDGLNDSGPDHRGRNRCQRAVLAGTQGIMSPCGPHRSSKTNPMKNLHRILAACAAALLIVAYASAADWTEDYSSALAKAKKEHKLLLLNFTGSDWCTWCKRIDAEVLDTQKFKDFADQKLVLVTVDFPKAEPQDDAVEGPEQGSLGQVQGGGLSRR